MALRSSSCLLVTAIVLTLVLFFSLRSDAAPSSWRPKVPLTHNASPPPPPTRLEGTPPRPGSQSGNNYKSVTAGREEIDTTSEIGRASNATLGYEKVFVLGLPERSDKKDVMVLSSSLTGFNVEFFDGMRGEDIPDVARPPGVELRGGVLGSWRTHLNVIRSIIENKLSSAFIMEDDVDWDVRLLSQLPELARGVRSMTGISPKTKQLSPYGDDWDVIWAGHCGDEFHPDDDRRYIIPDDPTVPLKEHQAWMRNLQDYPEHTRIVHRAGAPICTFGYGVSYRGAQKIIMALGIKAGANLAMDNALAFLCREGLYNIKCYSIAPTLFNHHRPAGSVNKDSDIKGGESTVVREKGFTEMIELSARLNLEQVITGSEEYVRQW